MSQTSIYHENKLMIGMIYINVLGASHLHQLTSQLMFDKGYVYWA